MKTLLEIFYPMNEAKLTNMGGKRKGAGRPKSEIKTKALGLRVPVEYHQHLSDLVRAEVKRLQEKATNQ